MYLLYWVTELGMWVGERIIRHLSLVARIRKNLANLGQIAGITETQTGEDRGWEACQPEEEDARRVQGWGWGLGPFPSGGERCCVRVCVGLQ